MSLITEQIKALKEHADYMQEIGRLFTASVIRHAAETIEALEQETCEDAISRENLLLWLDDIKESARKHVGFLLDVQRHVRSMPPVNAQLKTAYWIDIDDIESECSECGHREPNERFIFNDINYCAKCGAKMVESQESKVEDGNDD